MTGSHRAVPAHFLHPRAAYSKEPRGSTVLSLPRRSDARWLARHTLSEYPPRWQQYVCWCFPLHHRSRSYNSDAAPPHCTPLFSHSQNPRQFSAEIPQRRASVFLSPKSHLISSVVPHFSSGSVLFSIAYFPSNKNLNYMRYPIKQILSPIRIRITPPRICAFPASFTPNFFPIFTPAIQITNVTIAMIKEEINA